MEMKKEIICFILLISLCVTQLIIQLKTGYSFDRSWNEAYSKEERPNFYMAG